MPCDTPTCLLSNTIQRDGLWPQLDRGGSQGIRRLQRVAALDAPPTHGAVADAHVEAADDGRYDRQVLLILGRDTLAGDRVRSSYSIGGQTVVGSR